MKLTFTTLDFDETTWADFAQSIGWTEKIMTNDQSPNIEVDNPTGFKEYIIEYYGNQLYIDLANFNISQIKAQTDAQIAAAEEALATATSQALEDAKTLINATIE